MLLKSIILDFYDAISGKEKTRASLAPYVSDEALQEHVEVFEKAFPQYRLQVEDMLEQDDKVVVRARFFGTHKGEFNGIAPTGRNVEQPFIIIYRLEGGKIVQHWLETNFITFLEQLGVMNVEAQQVQTT